MVAAEHQIALEYQVREKVVNEEFKIWKKTVPLLYNTIHTHASKWPILTVQFLPDYTYSGDKNSILVKYITGTNTSGASPDSVAIRSISLPATLAPDFSSVSTSEMIPVPMEEDPVDPSKIVKLWSHPGEVNTVRVSPDGTQFVTFDNKGCVHLFHINSETSRALPFHKSEGFALAWTSNTDFLSGASDGLIARWNTQASSGPVLTITSHTSAINGISYSEPSQVLFGSVSDDYNTHIHDLRASEDRPAIEIAEAHIQEAIAFHPSISYLFATGGKDNVVNLYDARNTKAPIRQLHGHNGSVAGLCWNPTESTALLSWGLDRRVITWDLTQLRDDFNPGETYEGKKKSKLNDDPCLQFIHGGHTSNINDFAVHPSIPNLFASVADDNLIEVYQPKTIEGDEEEEEEDEEDEEDEDEGEAEPGDRNNEADGNNDTSENSPSANGGPSPDDAMELDGPAKNGTAKSEPASTEVKALERVGEYEAPELDEKDKPKPESANDVQDTQFAS